MHGPELEDGGDWNHLPETDRQVKWVPWNASIMDGDKMLLRKYCIAQGDIRWAPKLA